MMMAKLPEQHGPKEIGRKIPRPPVGSGAYTGVDKRTDRTGWMMEVTPSLAKFFADYKAGTHTSVQLWAVLGAHTVSKALAAWIEEHAP